MATYEEYVSAIKKYVPVSENLPSDYFFLAINQARSEIASYYDVFIKCVSFSLDSPEIDISSATGYSLDKILKIMSVVIVQDNLRYEIARGFKENISFRGYMGYPIFYYIVGNMIGFFPEPIAGLEAELKLSLKPDDLTIGQTDSIPDIYKPLIIYLSCSHIANMVGNANLSIYFRELYESKKTQVYRVSL